MKFKALFQPPMTRNKVIKLAVLILLIVLVLVSVNKKKDEPVSQIANNPIVYVGTVADIQNNDQASFVGTVRAVNEAQIQSEASGRVTSVSVKPGDQVTAGTVLASLENSSAQAALLQAQGAYEATLATAAQSNISESDANNTLLSTQNSAINTYRNAYATVNGIVLNDIDVFFGNPTGYNIPGVRINSFGNTAYLNEKRIALRTILPEWKNDSNSLSATSDLNASLSQARQDVQLVVDIIDILINVTAKADNNDTLNGLLVTDYTSGLTTTRLTLNGILNSLSTAETSLQTARENLRKAQIGSTQNPDASLANAQVKQALGVLRSAQAAYEKTILRTPISGTVNSLTINVGDYVTAFTQVAEVANNNALEVSIFVGESDLKSFVVGGEVTINNTLTGIVTSVAPAIDPTTQKTEVKVATESTELTNGSTVTIGITKENSVPTEGPVYVPITAVKFEAKNGVVFTVADNTLVSNQVTVGTTRGSSVEILNGISNDTVFVIDARGLSEGQKVEALKNK